MKSNISGQLFFGESDLPMKIKSKYKKYFRPVAGSLLLAVGIVFMLIPFIPIGYMFIIAGLFLLAYEIPALKKVLDKIKAKDSKGRVEKVEQKMKDGEQIVEEKFIEDEQNNYTQNKPD